MRYVIDKKMSGTGTIADLADENHTRIIDGDGDYAVVYAAHYRRGHEVFRTSEAAARAAAKIERQGYVIGIVAQGVEYESLHAWIMDPRTPSSVVVAATQNEA